MKEKSYAIDIRWFRDIHCRHPRYGCINFTEFFILNDDDEIIDSICLYDDETSNKIIYFVEKERYDRIKKYMNKEMNDCEKQEKLEEMLDNDEELITRLTKENSYQEQILRIIKEKCQYIFYKIKSFEDYLKLCDSDSTFKKFFGNFSEAEFKILKEYFK